MVMTDKVWKEKYGDVVWAKFKTFPWWPAFVIDPEDLAPTEESFKQAQKEVGKSYCVVFYGDHTTGIIKPTGLKELNDETNKEFLQQKLSAKYQKMLPDAIKEAQADLQLSKEKRFSWYFKDNAEEATFVQPVTSDIEEDQEGQSSGDDTDQVEVKTPKRKRQSGVKAENSNKKSKTESGKKRGRPRKVIVEEENSASESDDTDIPNEVDDNDDEDEVSIASDDSKSKKRKNNRSIKRMSKQNNQSQDMDVRTPKEKFKMEKNASSSSKTKTQLRTEEMTETLEQRLTRWKGILYECHENPENERILKITKKILVKLNDLPVTIQELRDTGVGKTINKLMKHPDSEISRSCDQLKQKWVALNAKQEPMVISPPPSFSVPGSEAVSSSTQVNQDFKPGDVPKTPKSKVDTFDEVLLPEDVKSNVLRNRSIHLFTSALKHMQAGILFESILFRRLQTLSGNSDDPQANYSEAVTRVFAAFKEMKQDEADDLIKLTVEDESNFSGLLRRALLDSHIAF